jgi:RNA polymerase sigma-70 factor (ECF subfamily)
MRQDLLRLLDTHGTALHATLWRLTLRQDVADDLLQELFVKLVGTPRFHAASNPTAYLKRAAINLALDWRRARQRQPVPLDTSFDAEGGGPPPHDAAADAEQLERVLDASARLPELSRQAFVMRHVQQESFEAIAAALGKTPHQARGLCHHAVRQLRAQLNPAAQAGPLPEVSHG